MATPCTLSEDDIDCWWTVKASAMATLDSICCLPCCCFCGGCCGRYSPFITNISGDTMKPGSERCQGTCMTQMIAGIFVPFTGCLCLWGCCGAATSCARAIATCVVHVEHSNNTTRVNIAPPGVVEMSR